MSEKPSYDELKNRIQELEKIETKLILTQKQLQDSENRLHSFLSNSPVGIGLWDREYRYVYVNEILQKINGPSLDEHLGKTIEEVLPKAAPIIRPVFEMIFSTGKPALNIELSGEVPATPGKVTHYLLSYFPIAGKTKNVEYIGGIVVDITDRKNTEEKLRQQQKLFKTIIDNIPALITLYNPETQVLLVNNAFETTVGWTNEDLKTIDIMEVCYPDPDYRSMAAEYMQKASNEWQEFRVKTKPGHSFDSIWSNVRLEDGTQVGIGIDISDKKKLEKSLMQSQKMESIGNLAGGIAHEFNNVLSIILGNTELILEDLPEWSPSRENAEEIRIAGMRARDVVKQLLTFSRQDNTQKKIIDMASVVRESMKLIRSSIPANIEIQQNLSDVVFPVLGNPTQINQLLINLFNNAVDAIEHADDVIKIELCNEIIGEKQTGVEIFSETGRFVKLVVSDNGVGIDKGTLDKIFEPYYTTKEIGKGTGIGLAVVHGIVERHGGFITVESHPGQGAKFIVLLPAHDGPVEKGDDEQIKLPTGNERILYVDDEPSIAKLGQRHLESLGYNAKSTTDPLQALKMIKEDIDQFDLVISDMAMPKMTGEQLVSEILKIRSNMPTIICTGYSETVFERNAKQIGVSGVAMKPLDKAELAKKVRDVLDEYSSKEDVIVL